METNALGGHKLLKKTFPLLFLLLSLVLVAPASSINKPDDYCFTRWVACGYTMADYNTTALKDYGYFGNLTAFKAAVDEPAEVDGLIGYAQEFDGVNSSLVTYADDAIDPEWFTLEPTWFTVSLWINGYSLSTNASVIVDHYNISNSTYFGYQVKANGNGTISFLLGANSSYAEVCSSTLAEDTYHFLTLTYNSTVLRGYVNGSLINTVSANYSKSSVDLGLGGYWNGTASYEGVIDEFRILYDSLTETEVQSYYEMYLDWVDADELQTQSNVWSTTDYNLVYINNQLDNEVEVNYTLTLTSQSDPETYNETHEFYSMSINLSIMLGTLPYLYDVPDNYTSGFYYLYLHKAINGSYTLLDFEEIQVVNDTPDYSGLTLAAVAVLIAVAAFAIIAAKLKNRN